ncbi:hypothetical protein BH09SUM1_BH09SUM1_20050 [soil metagenome]
MNSHNKPYGRPRARLVEPTAEHESALLEMNAASAEYHNPWVFPPIDAGGYRAYLERIASGRTRAFLVLREADSLIAGVINFNEIVRGALCSSYMGFYGNAAAAGQALMSEGMTLALALAFGEIGLHRVEANIQPANERSVRLVRKMGFRKEGFSERYLFIDGAWRDHERWAMLKENWKKE